jgi:hypothetical protein
MDTEISFIIMAPIATSFFFTVSVMEKYEYSKKPTPLWADLIIGLFPASLLALYLIQLVLIIIVREMIL